MAKNKGGREVRKPKQPKEPKATTSTSLASRIDADVKKPK